MMQTKTLLAALSVSAVTGCCAGGAVPIDPCAGFTPPLRFSEEAILAMDGEDLRRLDAYYQTGETLCDWEP